jgi:hypothetical protein
MLEGAGCEDDLRGRSRSEQVSREGRVFFPQPALPSPRPRRLKASVDGSVPAHTLALRTASSNQAAVRRGMAMRSLCP